MMKKLETVLISLFLLLFFTRAQLIIQTTKDVLAFWFEDLIPSLFPCIFLIHLLSTTSFFPTLAKPFSFLCPLLNLDDNALGLVISCLLMGAPSSTVLINEALKENRITFDMAKRLCCTVSVSSVSFYLVTCGVILLKNQTLGILLWIIQLFVSLLLLMITKKTKIRMIIQKEAAAKTDAAVLIKNALFQTGSILFLIGGYLLIFQTLADLLTSAFPDDVRLFFRIISEFAYGCKIISSSFNQKTAFVLMSTLCGFNGLCLQFQSLSLSEMKLPVIQFVSYRCLQALLCFVTAAAVILLLP